MSPKSLYLAVPCENSLDPDIAGWLLQVDRWTKSVGWRLTFTAPRNRATCHSRNLLCGQALKSSADLFLTLDSDCRPDMEGFLALIADAENEEVDVVGGWSLVFRKSPDGVRLVPNIYRAPAGEETDWSPYYEVVHAPPGCHEITGNGMGSHCLLIKRRVLQGFYDAGLQWFEDLFKVEQSHGPLSDLAPTKYPLEEFGLREQGHDLTFCLRAKDLGFRVYVDNRVLWGHQKGVDLADWWRTAEQDRRQIGAVVQLVAALQEVSDKDWVLRQVPPEFLMRYAYEADGCYTPREHWLGRNYPGVEAFSVNGTLLIVGADETAENRACIEDFLEGRPHAVEVSQCADGRGEGAGVTVGEALLLLLGAAVGVIAFALLGPFLGYWYERYLDKVGDWLRRPKR
jgi:hypothetical protein